MPYTVEQKIKLLVLWDILCRNTDEAHALNTDEIIEMLAEKGINVGRKVLSIDELESSKRPQCGQPKDTVSTVFFRFTRSFREKSNVSLRLFHPFGVAV